MEKLSEKGDLLFLIIFFNPNFLLLIIDTIVGEILGRSEFRSKLITTAGICMRSVEIFHSKIGMFIAVFKN